MENREKLNLRLTRMLLVNYEAVEITWCYRKQTTLIKEFLNDWFGRKDWFGCLRGANWLISTSVQLKGLAQETRTFVIKCPVQCTFANELGCNNYFPWLFLISQTYCMIMSHP